MLNWPDEIIEHDRKTPQWSQINSNYCLDFHGDPIKAKLVIFSDGNHHMALLETINRFCQENPILKHVFYATTPPGPILESLKSGSIRLNNLVLSVKPHLFISPPHVLDRLVNDGLMKSHRSFVQNRGNVLLIRKGNPKKISGIADLFCRDLRLFLSNPDTETVSYQGYVDTLKKMAGKEGFDVYSNLPEERIVYGERIHHREAPQSLIDGRADVAIVYYHLALRYTRIFPNLFEMVALGGTIDEPIPGHENVIGYTHVGLIGDGGEWGAQFLEFLSSNTVTEIYQFHGLQRT